MNRDNEFGDKNTATSMGKQIYDLRIERWVSKKTVNGHRATKEFVALSSGITSKSLTEIEDGKTKQPARETLQAIVNVLDQFEAVCQELCKLAGAAGWLAGIEMLRSFKLRTMA